MKHSKAGSKAYIIYLFFLLSGFSGLIYEILWVQVLSLIFGVSYIAVTTIVSAYMAGMGLGAITLRKYIDGCKNPLRLYALCELGIGLCFYFFLKSVPLIKQIFIVAHGYFGYEPYLFTIVRFVIIFVFFLVPTMLMGATLPALARCLAGTDEEKGGVISVLYGLNTLGATAGCFLTGFFFIGFLGIPVTNNIALGATFFVALTAFIYSGRHTPPDAPDSLCNSTGANISRQGGISGKVILTAFFISGFTALSYEILWSRIIIFRFGHSDIHAFSTILSSYLIGIGTGSLIFDRVSGRIKNHVNLLVFMQLALVVLGFLSYILYLNVDSFLPVEQAAGNTFFKSYFLKFMISLFVMLPATLIYGFIFPLFNQAYRNSSMGVAAETATAYSINTAGSIAGSLAAGFVFIPFTGIKNGIIITGLLNVLTVVIMASASIKKTGRSRIHIAAISAAAVFALTLPPLLPYKPLVKFGAMKYAVLYYKEGIGATLTVIKDMLNGTRYLYVNSAPVAFSNYSDLEIQVSLAQLPLIFSKDPRRMLVIGFGSGTTSGSARKWAKLQNLTCVELEKHEKDTARFFSDRNYDIINNPDFHIIINDGRNHLLTTGDTYDVISRDTLLPAQSSGLYSKDFYELCKKRLGPNGIFCGYIPISSMEDYYFRSTVKTVAEAFRNVTLWWVNQESMIVLGTDGSLDLDYGRMTSLFGDTAVKAEFERINIKSPDDILARYIMGNGGFGDYFKDIDIITDLRPIIINSSNLRRELSDIVNNLINVKDKSIPQCNGLPQNKKEAIEAVREKHFLRIAAVIGIM